MNSFDSIPNSLEALVTRVERGETAAATALRGALQPQFARIVRHTLRYGTGESHALRQVMAKARQLAANAEDKESANEEWLAGQVASTLCSTLIDRLRSRQGRVGRLLDTALAQDELLATMMA